MNISIIIPCYNEEEVLPLTLKSLKALALDLVSREDCSEIEFVMVDDGSQDRTFELLTEASKADKRVKVIRFSRNFGHQAALLAGYEFAKGDVIVSLDADLQDPPELIEEFIKKWMDGFDVVYGKRTKREASILMNFAYKLFYRIFNKLSYIDIPFDAGDFSLMDKKVVEAINKADERDRFIRGLRAWVGFKQTGISYTRVERKFGKTTNSFLKNVKWAKKGIFSFSFVPLELISYLSYFIVLLAAIALVVYILLYYINPGAPKGITTLIVIVLFIGGIQLLSISILSEYIGKILEETKKRPQYIIKKILNNHKEI